MSLPDRTTVNFFHRDIPGSHPQWAWYEAEQIPAVGDHVITPTGSRWTVVARTWQRHERAGIRAGLHCNVVVEDWAETEESR